MFRPTTKTGDFAYDLCNQVWAGFWSHDGQLFHNWVREESPTVRKWFTPLPAPVLSSAREGLRSPI